jgi:hypothetical protein
VPGILYILVCIKIQNDFAKHIAKEEEVMNKKTNSGDYLNKNK